MHPKTKLNFWYKQSFLRKIITFKQLYKDNTFFGRRQHVQYSVIFFNKNTPASSLKKHKWGQATQGGPDHTCIPKLLYIITPAPLI
jgi:hypothetical protein